MKLLLPLIVLVASTPAFAFQSVSCQGNENYGTSASVSFQIKASGKTVDDVTEGEKVPYVAKIKAGSLNPPAILVDASKEDVMFSFSARDPRQGKLSGMIYLDEMDQSYVNYGSLRFQLDCDYDR